LGGVRRTGGVVGAGCACAQAWADALKTSARAKASVIQCGFLLTVSATVMSFLRYLHAIYTRLSMRRLENSIRLLRDFSLRRS
jgi:hypothetical protein